MAVKKKRPFIEARPVIEAKPKEQEFVSVPGPRPIRGGVGKRDRLEVAEARAKRAGIDPTSARFPILKQGEITTVEDIRTGEEEIRRKGIEEATGVDVEIEELKKKVLEKEQEGALVPEPIFERLEPIAEFGLKGPTAVSNLIISGIGKVTGRDMPPASAEEFAKTKVGKALGLGIVGTTAALAGLVVAPYVAGVVARSVVLKAMAGKAAALGGFTKGILAVAVGGGLLNWDGLEMNTHRKIIGGYVEDGEKLVAIDRASGDHEFILSLLMQASDEIDDAESALKLAGRNNVVNLVGKQYLDDMNNIRTARFAIFRRMEEIRIIATTGQAALKPEELLYGAAQFEG